MTFEITDNFDSLITEEDFKTEYKGNLLKLCKNLYESEGNPENWTNGTLKLVKDLNIHFKILKQLLKETLIMLYIYKR